VLRSGSRGGARRLQMKDAAYPDVEVAVDAFERLDVVNNAR
jgi:hypothetical protein